MVFFNKMKLVREKYTKDIFYIVHDFEIDLVYIRDEPINFINLSYYKNIIDATTIEIDNTIEDVKLLKVDIEPDIKNKNYFYSLYSSKDNKLFLKYNNLYDGLLYPSKPISKKELRKKYNYFL